MRNSPRSAAGRLIPVTLSPCHLVTLSLLFAAGCNWPGKPDPADRPVPADKVLDFAVLYGQNCSGCHGAQGKMGPAPPLNDARFLNIIPDAELLRVIERGRGGTPMPAFAKDQGGSLSEAQVKAIATGIRSHWAKPSSTSTDELPPYLAREHGNAKRGEKVFSRVCAMCHGEQGKGSQSAGRRSLRINDPAFLALISDQALRRIVITGRPDLGMPSTVAPGKDADFEPLSATDVDDVVALLSSWAPQPRAGARGQDR